MKNLSFIIASLIIALVLFSCSNEETDQDMNIIFLHHSTGDHIYHGRPPSMYKKAARKLSHDFARKVSRKGEVPRLMDQYNKEQSTSYKIEEMEYPKPSPYGWNNYPFDYYNIWVANAGDEPFNEEPTLEMLTKEYNMIIFKHCYPVSNIMEDRDSADINSHVHTIANYKLQYNALLEKMHTFPETKFIVWTGAAQVENNLSEDEAKRARIFFDWVKDEWDQEGDNVFIWDLYELETEGGLFLKDEYAVSPNDSHPNKSFSKNAAQLFFNRIVDIIENNGEQTSLTGKKK